MNTQPRWVFGLAVALSLSVPSSVFAQEPNPPVPPPSGSWHRFGEPLPANVPPPSTELTLPAGSWITVRVTEPLSSDHNQPGDGFSATLVQPLVADGRVIARRGQTVGGRVAEAQKAGRVKGTSRLGIELIEISLVDGQQLPVKTQLIERQGDTSVGRNAAAIGAGTGVGAAIGAAAGRGSGAAIGAGVGAAASTIGVLVTRGKPTVVYPEAVLTFRLEAPLTVSTERAEEAFQPVTKEDYAPTRFRRRWPPSPRYAGYYPPFFYGPAFSYSGPRFYYRRGYYRYW